MPACSSSTAQKGFRQSVCSIGGYSTMAPGQPSAAQTTRHTVERSECMQYTTGITHSSDIAGGSYCNDIQAADANFSYMEAPLADLLLEKPLGTYGLSTRKAPWVVAHIAFHAWHTRKSLRSYDWFATKESPVLRIADVHPLLLRAIALLHQLALSRYSTVSSSAVDLIQTLYSWCRDLPLHALPAMTASAGLLYTRPQCGMPREAPSDEFVLPASRKAVSGMLEAQSRVRPCMQSMCVLRSVLLVPGGLSHQISMLSHARRVASRLAVGAWAAFKTILGLERESKKCAWCHC
jgi:hypothetical protein